ncbi:MAG: DsrE/DsrF/DrsH-like family protein [Alphaproteobacteria bacterium]
MSEEQTSNAKSMSLIVTKGSLDWAYPPFILATTAASMGLDVSMFFTFYGLSLLQKEMDLEVTSLGNPAMKLPMAGMHIGMPNLIAAMPGVGAMATGMMKNMIKKKGVATIEELRAEAIEGDVRLIGCQMTLDLFEIKRETLLDNIEIAGATTYVENALEADINLFI